MTNPFLDTIQALNESGCRYVIGGGFSVVMYGFNRFTPDLNIVLDLQPGVVEKGVKALESQNLQPDGANDFETFLDPDSRAAWHTGGAFKFLTLQNPEISTFCVQIYPVSPVPFEELHSNSKEISIYDCSVRICSLDDLYRMKQIASRPQDVVDLENLDIVKKLKNEDGEKELLEGAQDAASKEQVENLIYFKDFTYEQRIDWIQEMLEQLGRFCF